MAQTPAQRKEKIIALVQAGAPELMSDALVDLMGRIADSELRIGKAAWIGLCEILYPRPWPDPTANPEQHPRPDGPPLTFSWNMWIKIVAAVKLSHPLLSLDAWRMLFEEFLINPEMTVPHAIRRAGELAQLFPSHRSGWQP
jgi:hypothetical protein